MSSLLLILCKLIQNLHIIFSSYLSLEFQLWLPVYFNLVTSLLPQNVKLTLFP
jgi:hypothetical protein